MSSVHEMLRKLGSDIPDEHRDEFNRQVLYRNLMRVRVVCWAMLVALIPYALADYFTLSASWNLQSQQTALILVCVRAAIVLITIYFLLRVGRPSGPEELKPHHRHADFALIVIYMGYMGFLLGFMYSFRTELSVYLLFILIATGFLTWTSVQSMVILSVAFLSLAISLPLFGAEWSAYKYGLITLGIMTGVSYILAQLTRSNKIQDFLNRKTIERQNQELVRERAEAESARKIAVQASQAKSDFLASMSHEIRTPMNAVIGMTEVALKTSLEDDQRRYLNTAYDSAKQLLTIIDEILDFSKVEAGKLSLEHIEFNLPGMLNSVVGAFKAMAETKGLGLNLEIEGSLPVRCKGDQVRLRQVLINLLSNALKFTNEGGIVLSVWAGDSLVAGRKQLVRFSVIDTGIGVPEDKREKVFERFSQADNSVTRFHGGTGLGLTVSRRLAELMGGTLKHDHGFDGGSVFTLTVPLEPTQLFSEQEGLGELVPEAMSLHVLVVDDSAVNLQVTQTQLQMLGHTSETVQSGRQALEELVQQTFDLVLMDVEMPDMDGMTTTRIIRQGGPEKDWSKELRNIPVFALTAHAVEDVQVEARAAGMSRFLTKPMRMTDLEQALFNLSTKGFLCDNGGGEQGVLFDPKGAMEFLGLEREAYCTALQAALSQLEGIERDLGRACEVGNKTEIGQLVHLFKGTAQVMASSSSIQAVESVESAISIGDAEAIVGNAEQLLTIIQTLMGESREWLDAEQRANSKM